MTDPGFLRIDDVVKRFDDLLVYDGLTFDITEDELVTIFGPSGCGKTTLVKMLGTLEEPTSGDIEFRGESIFDQTESYKKQTAFVWQSDRLAPWRTAGGNIELALNLRDPNIDKEDVERRISESLEFVGLEQYRTALPRNLSGGMRQRINLARALSLDSEIIFMDEPLSGLNELVEKRILKENIIQLSKQLNKTIVYITHSIDDAVTMSDRIVVLTSKPTKILDVYEREKSKTVELETEEQMSLKKKIKKRIESVLVRDEASGLDLGG